MGYSIKKIDKNVSSTVKNPGAAIRNPTVQRDLLNAGLLSGAGGLTGQVLGAYGTLGANGTLGPRSGGGGGEASASAYNAYADPNSPESILAKGPSKVGITDLDSRLKMADGSAWLALQNKRQKIEEQQAMDNASRQAGTGMAMAQNQLAMRGGLSSGARERVAASSASGYNLARQGVARQGELARLGLGTEAEKMTRSANEFNAKALMQQQEQAQALENLKYSEQAKLFAAGKTADAMDAAARKKSGLEQIGSDVSGGWKKWFA